VKSSKSEVQFLAVLRWITSQKPQRSEASEIKLSWCLLFHHLLSSATLWGY